MELLTTWRVLIVNWTVFQKKFIDLLKGIDQIVSIEIFECRRYKFYYGKWSKLKNQIETKFQNLKSSYLLNKMISFKQFPQIT